MKTSGEREKSGKISYEFLNKNIEVLHLPRTFEVPIKTSLTMVKGFYHRNFKRNKTIFVIATYNRLNLLFLHPF